MFAPHDEAAKENLVMYVRPWVAGPALAALVGAVALAGCGSGYGNSATAAPVSATAESARQAAPATAVVKIADNSFTPEVRLASGGKVQWDWAGSQRSHSVVGTSANARDLLKSPAHSGGVGSYEATFAAAGTYEYQCGIHGASMKGKVTVE